MATSLIAFTLGRTVGTDQILAAGTVETLQGIFRGRNGRVTVEIKGSDNSYTTIGYLNPASVDTRSRQLTGPLIYRVTTRNAGCDKG